MLGILPVPRELGSCTLAPRVWVGTSAPVCNLLHKLCASEGKAGSMVRMEFGTRRPDQQDDPPTPSPAWTLVSHRHRKGSRKLKAKHSTTGVGLKHPPTPVRADPGPTAGRVRPSLGPRPKPTPSPEGRIRTGPTTYPPAQAPHQGTLFIIPRLMDGQPCPPSSWALKPLFPSLPTHCIPPPPSVGPVSFPAGMTTSASSPASQTLGLPSDPLPALQPQQNFLEPNPGTSCSLQPLPGFLGTQDEATHTPTTPRLLQGSGSKSLSLPLEMTTAPMIPP